MTGQDSQVFEHDPSRIVGFTDDTKYVNMIKNRPKVSLIPSVNKRILAQKTGSTLLVTVVFGAILAGSFLNQYR
jgi:hypothetical protein